MSIPRVITLMLLLVLGHALPAYAEKPLGFRFSDMRIMFLENVDAGAFTELENTNKDPYLIQSWIVAADPQTGLPMDKNAQQEKVPFVITPPLHRLDAGERYRWRIQRVGNEGLQSDRESVFYVALKAIPTTEKQGEGKGEFVLSPVIYQKMLYRPAALEELRTDMLADKATFRREGNQLVVRNDSPLYMTFATLQIGDYQMPDSELYKMVAPFAEHRYPLPASAKGDVMWRLLNEYAIATKAELKPL